MGEVHQETGRDGAIRAKMWLERTTRANVPWVNPDAVAKLTFAWSAGGTSFSFDLGGTLRGGAYEGHEFFAEVKKYSRAHDQGIEYASYLAKCYRALELLPARCDHFFWITWHPFAVGKWSKLCDADEVRDAVLAHRRKCLGIDDEEQAKALVDVDRCAAVAERLWLIVLSDKQETLVVEDEFLDAIFAMQRQALAS